jgi:hypothetical protein
MKSSGGRRSWCRRAPPHRTVGHQARHRRRYLLRRIAFGLALTVGATAASGQTDVDSQLIFTLWVDLEPAVAAGESPPRSEARAAELLFQEARFVLSGLVYGYTYEYVPYDATRRIAEEFVLSPRAEVQRGDPRLDAIDSYVKDKRVYTQFRYRLEPFQQQWLESWSSSALPRVAARGEHPWWQGHEAKLTAIEVAVKEAIRNYLRSQIRNKPRRARGSVILTETPRVYVVAGAYRAEVSVRIRVDELDPYGVY